MLKKIWIMVGISLLVSGCVKTRGYQSIPDVPDQWPAIKFVPDCPDVSGLYFVKAQVYKHKQGLMVEDGVLEFFFGYSDFISLPKYIILEKKVSGMSVFKFEKNGIGYWLDVLYFDGSQWVHNDMSLLLNERSCRDGLYMYPEYVNYGGSEFVHMNERSKRWIGKLEDGSLFVYLQKHKYKKFIFSNPEPEHIFYRFKPYTGELPQ